MSATAGKRGSATTTRLRKVECQCGCILRMSRAAMVKHGLPTCGCGEAMHCADVTDAALVGDCELEQHPDFLSAMAREANRAVREARAGQGGADRLRCGGCQAFIPAVNTLCRCGFENHLRGKRNDGRYVEGGAHLGKRDLIPF